MISGSELHETLSTASTGSAPQQKHNKQLVGNAMLRSPQAKLKPNSDTIQVPMEKMTTNRACRTSLSGDKVNRRNHNKLFKPPGETTRNHQVKPPPCRVHGQQPEQTVKLTFSGSEFNWFKVDMKSVISRP